VGEQDAELTPEQLVEQIKQLRIDTILLSTLSTLAQLGFAKLEEGSHDLEQARLAIEALRALTPVLEGTAPEEVLSSYRQATANLQLAYVEAAGRATPGSDG
jgi:hypothetical protein